MNNAVSTANQIKEICGKASMQSRLNEILGKNAPSFVSSLLQVVNQNGMLSKADPSSVLSAAMMAATLKLPINPNLGFAYIIPYKDEAQFQVGYKGFIQLAMRTGEFKTIAVTEVYEGEIVEQDRLKGYTFDWAVKHDAGAKPIGYVAYFSLLSGFEATNYMSFEQVQAHALKYSQAYKKGYGPWKDNFDGMAKKTVLKLLLSKFAPMSIEINQAIENDQAVIRDDNVVYTDNEAIDGEAKHELSTEKIAELRGLLVKDGGDEGGMCACVGVDKIEYMTLENYENMKATLSKSIAEKAQPETIEAEFVAGQEEDIPI